jgi:hypothetical protein
MTNQKHPPLINNSKDRMQYILEDKPAIFELANNPSANINAGKRLEDLPYAHEKGVNSVKNNIDKITQ